MTEYTNQLNVILPIHAARFQYLPPGRLGPAVGHGCKQLGIRLTDCVQITPEDGGDDRQFLHTYGPDTCWIKFSFEVPNITLQRYEKNKKRNPSLEPFDHLIAEYVADVSDRLAGALLTNGRVHV